MNVYESKKTNCKLELKSKLDIDIIKKTINNILTNKSDMCKYWENSKDNIWGVSFRVDESQYMAMLQTAFEITVLQDDSGANIVYFSKEIEQCDQWSPLYLEFTRNLI